MTRLKTADAVRVTAPDRSGYAPTGLGRTETISVNCRTENATGAGVHRYLAEILSRFDGRVTPVAPGGARRGLRGHAWEQAVLPARASGLLWSPANTGPLAVRRQVVTIHDVASLDHPEWFRPAFAAWYRFLTPRLVRRVRRVITVSEFSKERILAWSGVPPEKVVVIPNGVGRRFRPPDEEAGRGLAERYPELRNGYVLSVGSLEPRKNLRRLFAAWREVSRDFPRLTLAVAGAGGDVFSGTGFDALPDRVAMLGRPGDDELSALYGHALAMVYPSSYEGFGLPPLEAMACGTPVVVSNVSSLPELVGDAAVLVDPTDDRSIADGLRRVLGDRRLRDDLRARGLERAGRFTWDAAAERTWRVLRDAAESD